MKRSFQSTNSKIANTMAYTPKVIPRVLLYYTQNEGKVRENN